MADEAMDEGKQYRIAMFAPWAMIVAATGMGRLYELERSKATASESTIAVVAEATGQAHATPAVEASADDALMPAATATASNSANANATELGSSDPSAETSAVTAEDSTTETVDVAETDIRESETDAIEATEVVKATETAGTVNVGEGNEIAAAGTESPTETESSTETEATTETQSTTENVADSLVAEAADAPSIESGDAALSSDDNATTAEIADSVSDTATEQAEPVVVEATPIGETTIETAESVASLPTDTLAAVNAAVDTASAATTSEFVKPEETESPVTDSVSVESPVGPLAASELEASVVEIPPVVAAEKPFLGVAIRDVAGTRVTGVWANSTAAAIGIAIGDELITINGKPITDFGELREVLQTLAVGDAVGVVVKRGTETIEFTPAALTSK